MKNISQSFQSLINFFNKSENFLLTNEFKCDIVVLLKVAEWFQLSSFKNEVVFVII